MFEHDHEDEMEQLNSKLNSLISDQMLTGKLLNGTHAIVDEMVNDKDKEWHAVNVRWHSKLNVAFHTITKLREDRTPEEEDAYVAALNLVTKYLTKGID